MMQNVRHLRPEHLRGMRWRGYVRESTMEQADKWSPERQRSDIRRAADELGMVAAEPIWYERTGSGEKSSPELARALADAKAGAFDVLVIYTTSRFARNRAESVRVKAEFRKAGVPIYFVLERIVSGSRQNALLEGVKEVVDEEENETRRHWIAGGQRERMLSGRWVGNIPYGYRRLLVDFPDGRRGWDGGLEPDPDESVVVRRIFDAFVAGESPFDIAYRMNADGVPGPAGPWSRSGVVKLLRNPVYRGVLIRYRHARPRQHYFPESDPQDGRREIPGEWSAIVPDSLWASAQDMMDRRVVAQKAARIARPYPLSMLLRCADCGNGMSGVNNGYTRYYRCSERAKTRLCLAPLIRAEDAEAVFADWIGSLRLPPDWREAIAKTSTPDAPADDRRERLTGRLERLKKLYSWGDIDEAAYRDEVAKVRSDLSEVVVPSAASMADIAERLADLGNGWSRATPETQSAVARLMLREMVVRDAKVVALVARAEIRPLLDLCVPADACHYAGSDQYTLRFSA